MTHSHRRGRPPSDLAPPARCCDARPAGCSSSARWRSRPPRPCCPPPSTGPTSCASRPTWCCPSSSTAAPASSGPGSPSPGPTAILAVPMLLLPAALGRRDDVVLRAATAIGAASVVLSVAGFLRWVFVVPPLARDVRRRRRHHPRGGRRRVDGPAPVRRGAAGRAPRRAAGHRLVAHRGVVVLRTRVLPGWVGRQRHRRERPLLPQPGRHHGHGHPRLPGLGPRRPDRQHGLGALGGRARRRDPPAPGLGPLRADELSACGRSVRQPDAVRRSRRDGPSPVPSADVRLRDACDEVSPPRLSACARTRTSWSTWPRDGPPWSRRRCCSAARPSRRRRR